MPFPTFPFLDRLYMLPVPYRQRQQPLEVLALGPSRCGTDSLRAALDILDYQNTYHAWVAISRPSDWILWSQLAIRKFESHVSADKYITAADFDAIIGDSTAVTDTPCMVFSRELILAYPDAKVVLNTRSDVETWHASWLSTIQPWHDDWIRWITSFFQREAYWLVRGFHLVNMHFYRWDFRASGRFVYEEHAAMVRGMVPAERLLEWNVEDGWEPLCRFLGKQVPDVEFPIRNAGEDFQARIGVDLGRVDGEARRNAIVGLLAVVSGVVALLYSLGFSTQTILF